MMRYEGNERLADETACAGVRADLKMCLLESECCRMGRTPRQCLQDNNVPPECQVLRNTFYECKRSLVGSFTIISILPKSLHFSPSFSWTTDSAFAAARAIEV